ncbi:putative CAP domain protein, partial [Pseudoloma neurophilia]
RSEQQTRNDNFFTTKFVLLDASVIFHTLPFQSIVLLSGTLAPFAQLEKELKHTFSYKLIAPSIIKNNIFIRKVKTYNGLNLNGSYKNINNIEYIDKMIEIILILRKNLRKGGTVVFLPNYTLIKTFKQRIYQLIQTSSDITQNKRFKQSSDFRKSTFSKYYSSNNLNDENVNLVRLIKSSFDEDLLFVEDSQNFEKTFFNYSKACHQKKKPLLLSVYRGKSSEGTDFKDDLARLVICVSLPYPNIKDNTIRLHKEKKVNWYVNQCYRAINQAIGRIIRDLNDYGGVFLLEERVDKSRLSNWVQQSLIETEKLEDCLGDWSSFISEKQLK